MRCNVRQPLAIHFKTLSNLTVLLTLCLTTILKLTQILLQLIPIHFSRHPTMHQNLIIHSNLSSHNSSNNNQQVIRFKPIMCLISLNHFRHLISQLVRLLLHYSKLPLIIHLLNNSLILVYQAIIVIHLWILTSRMVILSSSLLMQASVININNHNHNKRQASQWVKWRSRPKAMKKTMGYSMQTLREYSTKPKGTNPGNDLPLLIDIV